MARKGEKMPKGLKRGPMQYFSQAVADRICREMQDGLTLRKICQLPGMPPRYTIFRWRLAHPKFDAEFEKARVMLHDHWADDILEIADDASRDTKIIRRRDGTEDEVPDYEWMNRSRLRVDARKWLLSKLQPDKYGDAVALRGDPRAPVAMTVSWLDTPPATNGNGAHP